MVAPEGGTLIEIQHVVGPPHAASVARSLRTADDAAGEVADFTGKADRVERPCARRRSAHGAALEKIAAACYDEAVLRGDQGSEVLPVGQAARGG